jgi:DNA-binding transcriptional LysR family regulator
VATDVGGDAGRDTGARVPPGVDLRLLLPFAVLAEELHFGRAAARLHLTQSALSQQIQRLERQVGVELVERGSRRVALAPAGHVFLAGARDAVEIVARAVREARRTGLRQATVRIGVDIDLPDTVVRRLRLFGTRRPDLLVRLSIQQQDDVVADLRSGRSDLALGWTAPPAGADGLTHTRLATVELHGVVRRDDPIGTGPSLARAGLSRYRLVMYRPSSETQPFYDFFLDAFVARDGARPRVVHVPVLDDAQAAMLDAVERSGGFTLCVGGDFARFGRPGLVGLPFDPSLTTDVVVMWRGAQRPPVVDDLTAFVGGSDRPDHRAGPVPDDG